MARGTSLLHPRKLAEATDGVAGMAAGGSWSDGNAPTAPLPGGGFHLRGPGSSSRGDTGRFPRGGIGGNSGPGAGRRHRRLRRAVAALVSLVILGVAVFAAGLLLTPSVGNAPAIARSLDRAHHAVYPGPPVPPRFAASLVSTEDHRFYSEPGIDPYAIARVIWGRITDHPDQGGATLYQQLAKMLYGQGRSGLLIEAEEASLGIKLDLTFSKAQILRMYADVVYFGNNYYGLTAASCGYFGIPPSQLTWPQAAMLAGIVQAPSADDPLADFAAARAREAHVLGRLVASAALTRAQATSAFRQPLHLVRGDHVGCAA